MFRLIDNLAMLSSASCVILMSLMVELSLQTCEDWSPWSPSSCQPGSQQMGSRECTSTNSRMELYTSKTRMCPGNVPVSGCENVNVNYGGNDIPGGLSKQQNWQNCQSSCKINPKCTHWTFRNSDRNCWFKTGNNVQVWEDGLVSGPGDCSVKLIDVVTSHEVTYSGLKNAIHEAQSHLQQFPQSEVIIHINSGLYKIPKLQHKSLMDFTGPQPGKSGRLILEGEGVDNTVLEVDPSNQIIRGSEINRLTVRNIQFRRSRPLTSQGVVKEVGKGFVVLDLEQGFPFIYSFFDNSTTDKFDKGKFLRKYTKKDGDCQIVEDWPSQVPWSTYTPLGQRLVKLHLRNPQALPPYSPGDLLGVKGKCCGEGKSAYWICGADDVVFENVKFDRQSRGVIRCKVNNVRFTNIIILRENKGWCMSTPDGGPQIGQPRDGTVRNVIVENLVAEHTGDDGVAFFNVESGGIIRNSKITNSFARGILLYKSKTTTLKNNVVQRCPILYKPKN